MTNELRWSALPSGTFGPVSPSADRRDLYLAVLACFEDAYVEPALNLEQLSRRLGDDHPDLADDDALVAVLNQLSGWGHLAASRDESATYSVPADFRRRSLQWSLTATGQAIIAALNAAAQRLAETAGLQPAAIDQIADALVAVAKHVTDGGDPAQVHLRLAEAETHRRSLVENLRTFTVQVQDLLSRSDITDDDLTVAKAAILAYLHRYVVDAGPPARRVAAALDRLERVGFDTVVEHAVAGANLAPGLGGDDPAVRAAAERRRDLDALDRWFRRERDGSPSQFAQLLPRGRDQILKFMRVLELRREQRRRAASLPDDFRALARAFAAAPGRDDCHRLWAAATGLHPARHHHLAVPDDQPVQAATSVATNPGVALAVELRLRPRSTGRPRNPEPVRDDRAARAARQRDQAAALAAAFQRRQGLETSGTVRLAAFGQLDRDSFEDLLDLLAQTLSTSPRSDGARATVSADGQVEIVIHPADSDARAQLASPDGVLDVPDLPVSVTLLGRDVTTAADDDLDHVDAVAEVAR